MKIEITQNKGIQYIKATNSIGMEVVFSSLGATIASIKIDGLPMTESPLNIEDLRKTDIYYGKTIGQIANRVKDGIVEIDGIKYQLEQNEGQNTLHGGLQGLSNQSFAIQRFQKDDYFVVIYSLKKSKKRGILPGKIDYFVVYTLFDKDCSLGVEFRAISDKDTVIALTNHSYFCLGESNLDRLLLQIPADRFVESDPQSLLPLRELPVPKCLDFRQKKPITKDINDHYLVNSRTNGYDHNLLFCDNSPIVLESPNYKLEILTDFTGAQIYTDNYKDGIRMMNSVDELRRGIAIEPQDSLLDRRVLKKGEIYNKHITYKFYKK